MPSMYAFSALGLDWVLRRHPDTEPANQVILREVGSGSNYAADDIARRTPEGVETTAREVADSLRDEYSADSAAMAMLDEFQAA